MKKIIIGMVLVAVVAALTGCESDRYPFIKIERDGRSDHDITIPIGRGFILTKQVYTIVEHKDGYDIIIRVKAGERE